VRVLDRVVELPLALAGAFAPQGFLTVAVNILDVPDLDGEL
jgi:hypothetical protein